MSRHWVCKIIVLVGMLGTESLAQETSSLQVIDSDRHHRRTGSQQEWLRFPVDCEGDRLAVEFDGEANETVQTLLIRQSDVRQVWKVLLNGTEIGRLQQDENDLCSIFKVDKGRLVDGKNLLSIEGQGEQTDDVLIGPVRLSKSSPEIYQTEASVNVVVRDAAQKEAVPCRLTIVDQDNCLVPVHVDNGHGIAVRTGVVYTGSGQAKVDLPAGRYRLFASRGFEYERDAVDIEIQKGNESDVEMAIDRQVDTEGWVACDTHIHTLTHSGHGDSSIQERVVTIAGEGIELAIATEHNKQIEYRETAKEQGVDRYFTPVIGNEVTTRFGHFNAFPFNAGVQPPNYREENWDVLIPAIFQSPEVAVVILNHGRDLHAGYRPFGPQHFNSAAGESLKGRKFLFNAMETINSGAQQTDQLQLFRDWMALTNRGHRITPIGSSDSHDVNRYIVGQGRTYVRVADAIPGSIDVRSASEQIRDGHVIVSAGLFVDASISDEFGPGDLGTINEARVKIQYSVRCPNWIEAKQVLLYQNGLKIAEADVADRESMNGFFEIDNPGKDAFYTVLAIGPGTRHPAWPMAQPYQADGPAWDPINFSFTGAIRVDFDGDEKFQSAYDYAEVLVKEAGGDLGTLLSRLKDFDESVSVQAASLWNERHTSIGDQEVQQRVSEAASEVKSGFTRYWNAWRESRIAAFHAP
ncbi:CehA/McbA family metallohydrolase [Stieleria sp. JC731]|uniref:CehA/McbA family metallohydrolase n=1 Tax=Pirellulaceae TaxID=2691357 RepID=UPI001E503730|nr:CehA/McbA family metallohydrolase [Stieleria sp. JC731]MCC9599539.1 CehA/McbA family metallohydrolase [Stieleria sp. JC731]